MACRVQVLRASLAIDGQELYIDRTQPLGSGAYGAVYKALWDQLPCVAKIIHEAITDTGDGSDRIIERFVQECQVLEAVHII